MANIYESQRAGKVIFLAISAITIVVFLVVSNNLIKELSEQERIRMEIWADATKRLANADENTDFDYLLSIIQRNTSIPVLVEDGEGNILNHRNFDLPVKDEGELLLFSEMSPQNQEYLNKKLAKLRRGSNKIIIDIDADTRQYIYYEDSVVLTRLSYYPYIQLGVMIVIALIVFSAIIYTKRAEQNRVWVGLSKETAHQLGTPISSLMAWTQLLESYGIDADVVSEIDKDVNRLSVIADRFSKIGSKPELKLEYLNDTVSRSLDYMKSRVSGKVNIVMNLSDDDHGVMLSVALFEWVMENLTKNAVDAMDGAGTITITTIGEKERVAIEINDTGKGISRKNFKNVFNPGYTTKKRGWGLGLTLVKRIIEEYHGGKIFVKDSEIGRGTTFRIELPSPK
ncbi:MAG: GHKL domain-containing protein [Bacteroidales bacterium]|nr:GHKL domain-containing protein [Bacteroidales bacterium]